MTDIALILDNNSFDIGSDNGDLIADKGLETAVTISLFTNRRVSDEELPDLETDKMGWWADSTLDQDQDQIGSRLWTLNRAKATSETLRRSEELCIEALAWMKDDGIADEIGIKSEYNKNNNLIIGIEIVRPDEETERFSVLWDEQKLRRV